MGRYIVKEPFDFAAFGSTVPIHIGEGVLVSYNIRKGKKDLVSHINLTVHSKDKDFVLSGPNVGDVEKNLREVEYNDLRISSERIKELHEKGEYSPEEQDEANYIKRVNTCAILNYLKKMEKKNYNTPGKPLFDKSVANWLSHQIAVKQKEYERLTVLAASDEDIIQNALMEYGNQERYNGDVEIANKITDVRNRYLEMLCESKNKE